MTQYEMTERISEKCNVTLEQAKAALEAGDWNMLTAAYMLEQQKLRRMQELDAVASSCATMTAPAEAVEAASEAEADGAAPEAQPAAEKIEAAETRKGDRGHGLRKLGGHICRLVARGNRNHFVIRKGGEQVLELPVTVLVLALLCAFWFCLPMLAIGLFAGFRYGFSGQDLDRPVLNGALDKAADAADHVKKAVAQA